MTGDSELLSLKLKLKWTDHADANVFPYNVKLPIGWDLITAVGDQSSVIFGHN